jgi:hypothetical protein
MSESNTDWIFVERPAAATRVEALKYFGVPPSSETELATNINTKRRRWHSRSNGPSGAEIAKLVKDIVRQLEDYFPKALLQVRKHNNSRVNSLHRISHRLSNCLNW